MRIVTARAPAKLILTGEHAVLHGVPAVAMAINCYCDTTVSSHSLPQVLFDLVNLKHKRSRTMAHLRQLKHKIQSDYHQFLEGRHSILKVLSEPFHLLEYTTSAFIEKFNIHLHKGWNVRTHSDIPTGYGLGSSAAAVVSTNFALNQFNGKNLSIEALFELNLDAENLQHGQSSGLDIQVSARGGCLRFTPGLPVETLEWPNFPLTLVLTGKPQSSTGECVTQSQAYFAKNPKSTLLFKDVSEAMTTAIQTKDFLAFKQAITRNQRLLERIKVIPATVSNFIKNLESQGFAAKVCGAGAISGDAAGVVAVFSHHSELKTVMQAYPQFQLMDAEIDLKGVHLLSL